MREKWSQSSPSQEYRAIEGAAQGRKRRPLGRRDDAVDSEGVVPVVVAVQKWIMERGDKGDRAANSDHTQEHRDDDPELKTAGRFALRVYTGHIARCG